METILLLHGALGSKEELLPLERTLSVDFTVHSINFHGHGGEPSENNFSIEYFARQVLDWMADKKIGSIIIIGYSLGGFVGLYLAHNYPEKIKKLITIGTKLNWDSSIAEKEIARLNPDAIQEKLPAFADALKARHSPEKWKDVLNRFADMLRHIGQFNPIRLGDYSKIQTPVLLMVGDRDKLVTFVETTTVYKELPNGQLAVLPNTPHSITALNVTLATCIIKTFINH
jgi:pimeloyl-ACP methyl ester carboxylesterase